MAFANDSTHRPMYFVS